MATLYILFGFVLCALAKRVHCVRLYNASRHSFRSGDPRVFSHYWKALDPCPTVWRFSLLVHGNTAWEVQLLWFVFMLYYKPVHFRIWRDHAWTIRRGWLRNRYKAEGYLRKASKVVLMPSIDYTMRSLITCYEQAEEYYGYGFLVCLAECKDRKECVHECKQFMTTVSYGMDLNLNAD